MIVKIVSLFLVGIAILGMFGRLRMPDLSLKRRLTRARPCPKCGAPRAGKGACPCGHTS